MSRLVAGEVRVGSGELQPSSNNFCSARSARQPRPTRPHASQDAPRRHARAILLPCAPPPKPRGTLRPARVSAGGAGPCLLPRGRASVARAFRGGDGWAGGAPSASAGDPSAGRRRVAPERLHARRGGGGGDGEGNVRDVRAFTCRASDAWWRPEVGDVTPPPSPGPGLRRRWHRVGDAAGGAREGPFGGTVGSGGGE